MTEQMTEPQPTLQCSLVKGPLYPNDGARRHARFITLLAATCLLWFGGCASESGPALGFLLEVDPDQERLGNLGEPTPMAEGNAGQDPRFDRIGISYVELTPNALTPLGGGAVLYSAPTTRDGGGEATHFARIAMAAPGEPILDVSLVDVPPGTYEYARVALAFQDYTVDFDVEVAGETLSLEGRLASFVEAEMYISTFTLGDEVVEVGGNRSQGYWAFYNQYSGVIEGQAPAGATTVPNPIADTSPTPTVNCIVTGRFETPLTITGDETTDVQVALSLSINDSFEWRDGDGDGRWDASDEEVVDMGLRGLVPRVVTTP